MEKIRPRIADFKNDLVFKYLLSNMKDVQCRYLLKLIIEDIAHIKTQEITVLNSELNPNHISDKDMILDVQVKTEDGELIDIEMQNTKFSREIYHRFQAYESRMLDHQVNRGDKKYSENLHKVVTILFIDDIDKDNLELIDAYTPRNRHGYVRKFNLIESYFVQLPFIKVIEKERGIKSFSKSEILIYILYQGLTHDIMTLDNEVVTIMKDKLEQFNEDEGLVLAAEKRQLVKIQHYQEEQRIRKESLEEGKAEGELLKAKENTIALFKSKFPQEHDEILENLTLEKYNLIFDTLINDQDLERIKEIISRD